MKREREWVRKLKKEHWNISTSLLGSNEVGLFFFSMNIRIILLTVFLNQWIESERRNEKKMKGWERERDIEREKEKEKERKKKR